MAQYGIAPMAAMSERFTASALCPRFSGWTSGKKCVPETIVSVDTARSMPLVTSTSAASSPTPSTALGVGRVKCFAIRSNSELVSLLFAIATLSLFGDLVGPDRTGETIKDAVYILVTVGAAEAFPQLDGLVDCHAIRDLLLVHHLPRADEEDAALDGA